MSTVDVAVVGRGLIGSAAARHLAEAGLVVALVGPAEPGDRQSSPGPFSSHADEGRITRICDESPVWSSLAARSIRRYPDIEARSQIPFHDGRGLLVSTPSLEEWIDAGLVMGATVKKVDRDWVLDQTGIRLPSDAPAAYESPPAGLINPRKLVAAQTSLAARAGAVVITDAVNELGPGPDGFVISGQWGSLDARQVLVATGAFGRHLYRDQLELERRPRTVLLAEMVPTGALPSLILGPPPDSRLDSLYWVPPVRYPDGRVYLKIGGSLAANPLLDDDEELVEWFHGDGDPDEVDALRSCLATLLPDTTILSTTTTPCVITGTPSGRPSIGWIDDGVAVAVGGNGAAAKSSDELGRLAATLFLGDDPADHPDPALFAPALRGGSAAALDAS